MFARLRLSLVLAAVAVAYGTAGYRVVERWGVLDAFYMTVITLTTVGYGEVHPLDAAGKQLFTISLLALGVVALAAAISAFTQLVAGGELGKLAAEEADGYLTGPDARPFIVCAYGRVGRAAVAQLRADGVPCLVVEPKPELAALLDEHGVPPDRRPDPGGGAAPRRGGAGRRAAVRGRLRRGQRLHHAHRPPDEPAADHRRPRLRSRVGGQAAPGRRRPGGLAVRGQRQPDGGARPCTRRSSASWTWSASPLGGGWRRPRSARVPGWTARRSGRSAPRIPMSGSSRSPSPAPALLAFPASEMTLGPGDLVLLLGPAAAVQAAAG